MADAPGVPRHLLPPDQTLHDRGNGLRYRVFRQVTVVVMEHRGFADDEGRPARRVATFSPERVSF